MNRISNDYTPLYSANSLSSVTSETQSSMSIQVRKVDTDFSSKITIMNFPSRSEVMATLEDFIKRNGYPNDYYTENKDNCLTIVFPIDKEALDFVKKLNEKKTRNSYYKNMVVTMELIPNQSLIQSIKQKKKQKNQLSQQSIERLYKGTSPCQLNKKKKTYLSTPYRSIQDKEMIERKVNKKRWVVNTDFNLFAGSPAEASKRYIDNFVGGTPSDPPVTYNFREVHREKWVSPTNFML